MKTFILTLLFLVFTLHIPGQSKNSVSEPAQQKIQRTEIQELNPIQESGIEGFGDSSLNNLWTGGVKQPTTAFFLDAGHSTSKIFIVNNDGDTSDGAYADGICADASGNCTLRAALEEARSQAGNYFITFSLPLPAVLNLTLGELVIERNVINCRTRRGETDCAAQRGDGNR
jgi:hypothetical protein